MRAGTALSGRCCDIGGRFSEAVQERLLRSNREPVAARYRADRAHRIGPARLDPKKRPRINFRALMAELVAYQKLDPDARKGAGFPVNYYGSPVFSVKHARETMWNELKLPQWREWKPYLLRHSLATILRNRGVVKWDLEGFMGHDATGSTETYAVGRFDSVYRALEDILREVDLRAPGALSQNCAEVGLSDHLARRLKMTG